MPVLKICVCSLSDVANINTIGATQAMAKKINAP